MGVRGRIPGRRPPWWHAPLFAAAVFGLAAWIAAGFVIWVGFLLGTPFKW